MPSDQFDALKLHMLVAEAAAEHGLSEDVADRVAETAATRFANDREQAPGGRATGRAEAERRFGLTIKPDDTGSAVKPDNHTAKGGRAFGREEAERRFGSTS